MIADIFYVIGRACFRVGDWISNTIGQRHQ